MWPRRKENIIVRGILKDLPTLEIRAKLADLGLDSFVRGNAFWEGEHVRLVLTPKDSKGLTKTVIIHIIYLACSQCLLISNKKT